MFVSFRFLLFALDAEQTVPHFYTVYPPTPRGQNKLGTCTVNIGSYEHFSLEGSSSTLLALRAPFAYQQPSNPCTDKLYACAAVGHQAIDLYEDDFLHYLSLQPGANKANLWEVRPSVAQPDWVPHNRPNRIAS